MTATIQWFGRDDADAYNAALDRADLSNLLQSWAWGEAKAEVEGWRPRRGLIRLHGKAVAAFQALEKRWGPIRLARLNRGPVLFADADLAAVVGTLRRRWRWWNAGALLIAPELPGGEGSTTLLRGLGLRRRAAPIWQSAWLDLAPDPADLRKSLNGKWRNMLVNAEKAGLDIECREGIAGVEWLMPRYQTMMDDKGFAATSPAMVRALARHAPAADMLTFIASRQGEPASAVLVVRHGATATYLIGWNDELGRTTRANHLLLWQALLACRERGCRRFDLGGIDDALTPGVARFKRGLNGHDYALAGEWVSL